MAAVSPPSLPDALRAALARHAGIELAILFGSLAQGAARLDSDLDLAVAAASRLSAAEKMALMDDLAQALGRPVDLVDLAEAGEPLLGQILSHGRRVLGSDARYARLLVRHLLDEADFLPYRNRILAQRRQAWIGL